MAYKKGKHRTGHTYRYVPDVTKYQRTPTVVKQVINKALNYTYENMITRDLKAIDVPFSLNKQSRWNLADHVFEQTSIWDKENIDLTMYELHKVYKDSNCRLYATSADDKDIHHSSTNQYINIRSIRGKPNSRHRRKRRRRRLDDRVTEGADQDHIIAPKTEVIYNFIYPAPETSFLSQSPKFLDSYNSKILKFDDHKGRKRYNRRVVERNLADDIASWDGICNDVFNEEVMEWAELEECKANNSAWCSMGQHHPMEICIAEILNTSHEKDTDFQINEQITNHEQSTCFVSDLDDWEIVETTKGKGFSFFLTNQHLDGDETNLVSLRKTASNKQKLDEEGLLSLSERHLPKKQRKSIIAMRRLQKEDDDVFEQYVRHTQNQLFSSPSIAFSVPSSNSVEMKPVSVIIHKNELTQENLTQKFSYKYVEAKTCLRRFLIDITELVTDRVNLTLPSFRHLQKLASFVLFSFSYEYSEQLAVYNIMFNSEFCVNSMKLETLFDLQLCTVEEVISAVLFYVDTLPDYCYPSVVHLEKSNSKNIPTLTFDTLTSITTWNPSIKNPNIENSSLLIDEPIHGATLTCIESGSFSTPPDYCSTCYAICDLDSPPFSLELCQHWSCENCWRAHVIQRINSTSLQPITCLEFACDVVLTKATILSLIPLSLYKSYLQRKYDNRIQRVSNSIWCPNPKCGRVVQVSGDFDQSDFCPCILCECGHNFCFCCKESAHWPASCQNARSYLEKRIELGDENKLVNDKAEFNSITLNVKNCPKCREAIDKNSGCPHMSCRCGHQFCWHCLRDWPEETACPAVRRLTFYDNTNADVMGTKEVTFESSDWLKELPRNRRSNHYLLALTHCRERNSNRVRKFKSLRQPLSQYLKNQLYKPVICDAVNKELGFVLQYGDKPAIQQAVDTIISDCMSLCLELHFVIEYACVYMDNLTFKTRQAEMIVQRMDFIVNRIHQIFEAGGISNQGNTFVRLHNLKTHAKMCINELVTCLSIFKFLRNT